MLGVQFSRALVDLLVCFGPVLVVVLAYPCEYLGGRGLFTLGEQRLAFPGDERSVGFRGLHSPAAGNMSPATRRTNAATYAFLAPRLPIIFLLIVIRRVVTIPTVSQQPGIGELGVHSEQANRRFGQDAIWLFPPH